MHPIHPIHSNSRRDFLKTTAIAATAAGLSGGLGAAMAKRKMIVGAHPWVYAATQPNYDLTAVLPQVFADFSYAGVDGIELMHTALRPDDAVARIGELSHKHRLPVIGASFGGAMWDRTQHAAVLEDAEKVITRLAQLGGRTLGATVGQLRPATPKPRKTPEQLDAQAECLRRIIALCAKHGVVLNLHNHAYEVENELHDLKGTLERIPEVKLGPDLNWLVRGGVNPAEFIRRYGKQIVFLHLRDQRKDGRWVEAIGEGDTDFAGIAAALKAVAFSGDSIIELAHEKDFKPTRPLRESVKLSRAFVAKTFNY
ncbi:MAG: sugar phosphate isomerase/epimerase [Opitutaceae bacterium]|nr:sugar phosphate isomerase/epimerase [Opitutaceae bacterium]